VGGGGHGPLLEGLQRGPAPARPGTAVLPTFPWAASRKEPFADGTPVAQPHDGDLRRGKKMDADAHRLPALPTFTSVQHGMQEKNEDSVFFPSMTFPDIRAMRKLPKTPWILGSESASAMVVTIRQTGKSAE